MDWHIPSQHEGKSKAESRKVSKTMRLRFPPSICSLLLWEHLLSFPIIYSVSTSEIALFFLEYKPVSGPLHLLTSLTQRGEKLPLDFYKTSSVITLRVGLKCHLLIKLSVTWYLELQSVLWELIAACLELA